MATSATVSTAYTASDYSSSPSVTSDSPIVAPQVSQGPQTVVLSPEAQRQQLVAASQQRIQDAAQKRKDAMANIIAQFQQDQQDAAGGQQVVPGLGGALQSNPDAYGAALVRALQRNAMATE